MSLLGLALAALAVPSPGAAARGASGSGLHFLPPVVYEVGAGALSAAIGDVTGDGRPDVLVATQLGGRAEFWDQMVSLYVYPGAPDGALAAPRILPTHDSRAATQPESARTVVAADLDRDGKTDAAVVTPAGVDVYYQRHGMLTPPALIPGTAAAEDVAAADLDRDGRTDLLVGRQLADGQGSLTLLHATAAGFKPSTIWTGPGAPLSIRVGDINRDGRPDIVDSFGWGAAASFQTLIQDAHGAFASRAFTPPGTWAGAVALSDVTGDGRLDLIDNGGRDGTSVEFVHPGAGTGAFGEPSAYADGSGTYAIAAADLDRDHRNDVVVASYGDFDAWPSIGVFKQQRDGTLGPVTLLPMPDSQITDGGDSSSLALGDLNADGRGDIVLANPDFGLVVYRQAGTDLTRPQTTISSAPPRQSSSTVTFRFHSTEPGGFECSLGGPMTPCTSPATFSRLAALEYGFRVRAIDRAGNADPTPAVDIFTVTRPIFSPLAPPNDLFANAEPLTGADGVVTGDNTEAAFEVGEPWSTDADPAARSVWFTWTAPRDGSVVVDTAGSSFDTVLHVWTGSSLSGLTSVAFARGGPLSTPLASFDATAGTAYRVELDGWTNNATMVTQSGAYRLAWRYPPPPAPDNDRFTNSHAIYPPHGTVTGTNVGATKEPGEPDLAGNSGGASVWYRWTPVHSGTVTFTTAGSSFDTLLGVYTGSSVGQLTVVGENDDVSGPDKTSTVTFDAVAGTRYQIKVDGYNGPHAGQTAGSIVLNWG